MAVSRFQVCLIGVVILTVGCQASRQIRDPDYAAVCLAVHRAGNAPATVEDAVNPIAFDLEGPHDVDVYVQFALEHNPAIQAARKRMEAFEHQVPVAASLQDPMLNLTAQPEPVQTAAGQQEWIVSANQKLPWLGKLGARANVAEAQTNVARAHFAAAELATIAKVKRAYYELYFVQQAISVTEAEQRLLGRIRDVANTRYKSVQTSYQDVLRADLEISNVENELIRLRQQLESGQARLARLLHVAPQTNVLAMDSLPPEQAPDDLDILQRRAVAARPELHAALSAIQRDQRQAALTRLEYKPDVTVGFSWVSVSDSGLSPVSNGRDAFLLTAGINLPVYRKRLDAAVRSAEAKAVSAAHEYDSLRDGTLEEVTDLLAQSRSQQNLLALFQDEILPKARQTLEVSSRAYNVGEVDFLQMIDNWRELLRYEVMYHRLEASLRQTLAELERVIGGFEVLSETTIPAPANDQPGPPVPLP